MARKGGKVVKTPRAQLLTLLREEDLRLARQQEALDRMRSAMEGIDISDDDDGIVQGAIDGLFDKMGDVEEVQGAVQTLIKYLENN